MSLESILKQVLPRSVRERIRSLQRHYRLERSKVKSKITGELVTKTQIIRDLERMGVQSGDSVIVHSSLSRLGLVDGGAATVVEAIRQLLGRDGTVVVPTIQLRVSAREHFASDPVFHVCVTPSVMGAISESARTLPDAYRSMHPTHSVAAVGKHAQYLTQDHHKSELPFGPYSPYYRLGELNGKIIMLGVPLASMTNFHVVEDIMGEDFPYPVYLPELVDARVVDCEGREFRVSTRIHNPQISQRRRCNEMEEHLVLYGVALLGKVGAARTIVLDSKTLNLVLVRFVQIGITMYTPDGKPIASLLKPR